MRSRLPTAALIFALACSGSSSRSGGSAGPQDASQHAGSSSGGASDDPRCAKQLERVRDLYRSASPDKPGTTDTARDEIIAANVDMAMADCRRDPARVAPCLESTSSAEDLEKNCLAPLDDQGQAEHKQFAGN